jgi:hypothetical protein
MALALLLDSPVYSVAAFIHDSMPGKDRRREGISWLSKTSFVDHRASGAYPIAVIAAANQCLHATDASISPGAVVLELRVAIAMLQLNGVTPPQRGARPILRVIEGGLSRA